MSMMLCVNIIVGNQSRTKQLHGDRFGNQFITDCWRPKIAIGFAVTSQSLSEIVKFDLICIMVAMVTDRS